MYYGTVYLNPYLYEHIIAVGLFGRDQHIPFTQLQLLLKLGILKRIGGELDSNPPGFEQCTVFVATACLSHVDEEFILLQPDVQADIPPETGIDSPEFLLYVVQTTLYCSNQFTIAGSPSPPR